MKSPMRRGTARLLVAGLSLSIALGTAGVGAGSALAADPDPILLVHGFRGSPSTFGDMIARFAAAGRTAVAIDLPSEDNVVNANAIRDFIAARGWTRVDLVGHSMGGLSPPVREVRGVRRRRRQLRVAQARRSTGSTRPASCRRTYGGQMCPTRSFIRTLNTGDDTPAGTNWMTLYSTADEYVPNSASRLDGGACHVR